MAGKGISRGAMWVLMGLLVIGLAGFGVTNLGGTVRSVGSVGDAKIDVNTYARALRNEMNALAAQRGAPASFAQAREAGLDQRVLAQLVARAALEHEAGALGISVGDEILRGEILSIPAFQGLDGSFDRQAYRFALQQSGLNEAQFEQSIRAETASTLVQAAALAGLRAPAAHTEAMIDWLGERRSLSFATLSRSDLATGLPEPSEDDLRAYHETHKARFTTPEARRLTYAWVTPEMLIDTVEVDDDALRAAYEERAEEFNLPERRLVERLVFADEAAATRAMDRIAEGIRLEMLVAERGLDMADIDLGDVTVDDLGAAAAAVFAAPVGEVVGPIQTSIGPALFRVNAVLVAQSTPFEDARTDLRDALALDRARRVIDRLGETADDLLAGGASLEDLARETDLVQGEIAWHPGMTDGIAGYPAFRRAAQEAREGGYPRVNQLEDGGVFALRLEGIEAPRIQPLDDVRDAVLAGWRAEATVAALREQAAPAIEALRDGASFADHGLATTEVTDLTRRDYRTDAPASFIETVFGMDEGEVHMIDGNGRLFILRLDSIAPPPENDPDLTTIATALADQVTGDLGQDLFQLLADDIRARAGVSLDQAALNAVHANFN
ncbi:peptidyl-prolyl cis-trans isomerase [Roseovarius autotrophicus]|uniref:peptidyl-prolyl cis-trans isomerase n=1 Tax=Roseovarius autotrophicus TaxID=2824121 RepID=UPI0019D836B8|nr:peptidyl-prolyl cis-trans isomerase [Roseovarius autotrophicus]MBE0452345.1 SurA N-terminal domain-containing protein [Roseovarius sp.]